MLKYNGNTIATNLPTKDITQANYDLLSSAEKNNGTIYFISNNPGSSEEAKIMYDGQVIATSTKFIEITSQAYSQLSNAEKNNNTIYLITDADQKHSILNKGLAFVGDTTVFADYSTGTMCAIIADLYSRLEMLRLSSNVSPSAESLEFLSLSAVNGLPIPSHPAVSLSDYGGTDPT